MKPDDTHHHLYQWIRETLQRGITMDRQLLSFMEQTFGTTDLVEVLADDEGSEAATLLELLFYPDDRLREAFETRWGTDRFTGQQVDDLIRDLVATPIETGVHLPDRTSPLTIAAPDYAVSAFVQRLNIAWQPPERLGTLLGLRLSDTLRARVGARLRRARLTWHPGQTQIVVQFLETIPPEAGDYFPCFDFLLSILNELPPPQPPFAFLMDKKFSCFQALCRAEAFERRRQTTNMEILMMQGERAAHGDVHQWRDQMRLIDRISQALYGETRFFQQPAVQETTVDADDQSQGMAQVLRLLD